MKMKMDMNKKKRARDDDNDDNRTESSHQKLKHTVDESNDETNVNSSTTFMINAGEGCSKNSIDNKHEEQEEEVNNEDENKSVFDFPWSKESDGGVNVFGDEGFCLELGLDAATFPSCNAYSYGDVILDSNLVCDTGLTSTSGFTGLLSDGLDDLPQQEKSDFVDENKGQHESPISSTFKVDELEGSDWINNLEQTNNATITTSAAVAN